MGQFDTVIRYDNFVEIVINMTTWNLNFNLIFSPFPIYIFVIKAKPLILRKWRFRFKVWREKINGTRGLSKAYLKSPAGSMKSRDATRMGLVRNLTPRGSQESRSLSYPPSEESHSTAKLVPSAAPACAVDAYNCADYRRSWSVLLVLVVQKERTMIT